jgi:hypothetical protein
MIGAGGGCDMLEGVPIFTVVVSAASLLISVVSVILAFVSFRRSKVFQEHEYAVRLQVLVPVW